MNARIAALASLLGVTLLFPMSAHAGSVSGTVSGTVFRDYNNDGLKGALEPGQPGITATATDASGATVGTATTAADGTYSLNVTGAQDSNLRIEFGGWPTYLHSGPVGSGSGTSVQFVTLSAGTATASFGIENADEFCQNNPDLVSSCYTYGDQVNGVGKNFHAIVSLPYTATGSTFQGTNTTLPTTIASAHSVGATFGLAYNRTSDDIYAAALQKQYVGFGPGGPGAIYKITSGGTVSVLATLSAGVDARSALPANTMVPPGDASGWMNDPTYDAVGKLSLGGIALSDDESTLYVMNLFDRSIYPVAVATGSVGSAIAVPLATGATGACAAADVRPFALAKTDGKLYIGEVCSAQSTQLTPSLHAYVYSFDPATSTFSTAPVLEFPLTFTRGHPGNCKSNPGDGNWHPWHTADNFRPGGAGSCAYPQPELTGLAFDRGNMIIDFRDRYGDQSGENFPAPDLEGLEAGDLLRACGSPVAGWTLESNGICGGVTGAGSGDGHGPGGGDFYSGDHFCGNHQETSDGGVAQIPGQPEVVTTQMDPNDGAGGAQPACSDWRAGGYQWETNATGARSGQSFDIYDKCDSSGVSCPIGRNETGTFGKSAGLGGALLLCNAAPLEIGNRVWFDAAGNGLQLAGQPGIKNVTVRLFAGSTLVATTTTDSTGKYLFNSGNVSGGVQPLTAYRLTFDISTVQPSDLPAGVTGASLHLSPKNAGTDAATNSKAADDSSNGNIPTITVSTGRAGFNDHTLDAGFTNAAGAGVSAVPVPTVGWAIGSGSATGTAAVGLVLIGIAGLLLAVPYRRRPRR